MMNWSAASTSSGTSRSSPTGAAALSSPWRRPASAFAAASGVSASIASHGSVDATSVMLPSTLRSARKYPGLHSDPTDSYPRIFSM
jgi:hypothetical protein